MPLKPYTERRRRLMSRCRRALILSFALVALLPACRSSTIEPVNIAALEAELKSTEEAFAATMAHRDHSAFSNFLADDAIFSGGDRVIRGKSSVAAAWSPYFEEAGAPFSWTPEMAVVLDSSDMGMTSGPVLDPEGKRIGTFNSVWRRDRDGTWKIIFDRGCPPCECP